MQLLFEVPYNFDSKLVHFYKKNSSYIRYLYIPPYKDDSDNTRTIIQTNTVGRCYMPDSRGEYERHLGEICEAGLRFVILWQMPERVISVDTIKYYQGLGSAGFIVANDTSAEVIKSYSTELSVTCSIVQRTCTDVLRKDFRSYDYVILYYPFNRALDALKMLGIIKDKIILMPNTLCNVDCPSMHHWFPAKDRLFDAAKDCPLTASTLAKSGLIFPEHLRLFDDYVAGYKLQGREYRTAAIKHLCSFYFKRNNYQGFIDPFIGRGMAEKLKELAHSIPPEEYYNIKSQYIINHL